MKAIYEFLHYMKLNRLDIVVIEVYKLSKLILSFLLTKAAREVSLSRKKLRLFLELHKDKFGLAT